MNLAPDLGSMQPRSGLLHLGLGYKKYRKKLLSVLFLVFSQNVKLKILKNNVLKTITNQYVHAGCPNG